MFNIVSMTSVIINIHQFSSPISSFDLIPLLSMCLFFAFVCIAKKKFVLKMVEDSEYRCFIGNLSWSTSDQILKDAFGKFGNLVEAKVRSWFM